MPTVNREEGIFSERAAQYGDYKQNLRNAGLLWTALLQQFYRRPFEQPIPADLVALMFAAAKLNRAAYLDDFDEDHYDDARIYLNLARECAKESRRSLCLSDVEEVEEEKED